MRSWSLPHAPCSSIRMTITYTPIGIIHSAFTDLSDMPIQPTTKTSGPGSIEIFPEYADGLRDVDGFSHIILLYHFHEVKRADLTVTPFLDSGPRGVFATRAPTRPNQIGLSVVRLVAVEDNTILVDDLDILDGTPLLDVKPYVPEFDHRPDAKVGWLEQARGAVREQESDERFGSVGSDVMRGKEG